MVSGYIVLCWWVVGGCKIVRCVGGRWVKVSPSSQPDWKLFPRRYRGGPAVSVRLFLLGLLSLVLLAWLRHSGQSLPLSLSRNLLATNLSSPPSFPPSSPPSSPAKHQTNIQQSWINAKSQDGFLDVDNILKDPRTTRDPLHMDNMIVPTRL